MVLPRYGIKNMTNKCATEKENVSEHFSPNAHIKPLPILFQPSLVTV